MSSSEIVKTTTPSSLQHPEVIALRNDIEQCVGRSLQSPSDFEYLIGRIWEKQRQVISLYHQTPMGILLINFHS